jgi:NFU1 iron-sulfur cluster scaffold homolog, mitochondrial
MPRTQTASRVANLLPSLLCRPTYRTDRTIVVRFPNPRGQPPAMFIETEGTPNPATLKFLPGRYVMEVGTADFASAASAARSPLATALFDLPGVARVFLGNDFVTVTKTDEIAWPALKPQVLAAIMEHFVAGRPVIEGDGDDLMDEDVDPADQEIVDQIKELLDTRVRPAVAGDGGDIVFRGYRDGIVRLHMQGSCSGCPSSRATLKHGIENMLRHYVPEVVAVEQVEL